VTAEEFDTFTLTLRQPGDEHTAGYYPQMSWGDRISVLWFQTLRRYPAAKVMRALELHYMMDPDHAPTLDAFLRDVKALMPPPPVPWQQFPQEQTRPMQQGGYGAVLQSLVLPTPDSQAWAKCWIWLFEQATTFPGREAECAQECRRFADLYPRDRDDWLRHARRLEEEATRKPQKPPRIQRDPVPLGRLHAPRPQGALAPHVPQADDTGDSSSAGDASTEQEINDDDLIPRD
jgi:hypothetical protein